jgi:hypothetical protein
MKEWPRNAVGQLGCVELDQKPQAAPGAAFLPPLSQRPPVKTNLHSWLDRIARIKQISRAVTLG